MTDRVTDERIEAWEAQRACCASYGPNCTGCPKDTEDVADCTPDWIPYDDLFGYIKAERAAYRDLAAAAKAVTRSALPNTPSMQRLVDVLLEQGVLRAIIEQEEMR